MFRWIRERFNPKPARPTREKVPELLITARQIIFEEPLPQPKPLPPPEPPPEAFTKSARRRRIEEAEAALPPSAPPAAELAAMLSLRQVDISEEEEDRVDQCQLGEILDDARPTVQDLTNVISAEHSGATSLNYLVYHRSRHSATDRHTLLHRRLG